MDVTDVDRIFYSVAVDQLSEQFEVIRSFARYNGISSLPMDDVNDAMISNIKTWLNSNHGKEWLQTMGFGKYDLLSVSGTIAITISGNLCPICGTGVSSNMMSTCEKCGRTTCVHCVHIVEDIYGIEWCNDCYCNFLK